MSMQRERGLPVATASPMKSDLSGGLQARCVRVGGDPGTTRTSDLVIRSHSLYPAELRGL
jgi:hypothetical protein